jgi:GT2 family glycosyltransferase
MKEMSPRVSVVIVNYNAGIELSRCVQSLVDAGENVEIIVVDNDSSDESLQSLSAIDLGGIHLVTIHNDRNRGFAVACNQGSRAARGDLLFYLNPDCVVEPNTISILAGHVTENNRVGMAGGLILNPDGSEQRGCRRTVPTPWRSLVNSLGLYRLSKLNSKVFADFRMDREALPEEPVDVDAISGACMMVSRKAFEDVGPMDEGYFLHCEDLDWCMRFRQQGWRILFVPQAKLTHNKGFCSSSKPVFVEWSKHKGMVRYYRKFFADKYSLPMLCLVYLGIWLRFCLAVCKIYLAKLGVGRSG